MKVRNYFNSELETFANAKIWKNYFSSKLKKHISGNVLEVGAGTGETTNYLINKSCSKWVCLEPSQEFCKIIKSKIDHKILPNICDVKNGTVKNFGFSEKFDTIIYINVLEHILDDSAELLDASKLLKQEGCIITLCPAHNFLFSPFDENIGRYRRSDKKLFRMSCPSTLYIQELYYLDSIGILAPFANKFLLKQSIPSKKQIDLWDKKIIPISKLIDFLTFYKLGRSIISIMREKYF